MKILKRQNLAGDNKHYYYQFKGKELTIPVDEFNTKNEKFVINSAILFKAQLLYSEWFIHFKNCINYPNYRQRVGLYEGSFIRLKNSIAESLNALNTQNVLEYNAIMLSEEVIPLMQTGTFKGSVLERDLQIFLQEVRKLYSAESEKSLKKLFNTSKKTAQFVEMGG